MHLEEPGTWAFTASFLCSVLEEGCVCVLEDAVLWVLREGE